MHEFSGFALTILAVLCTAWLNRADARTMKTDLKADNQILRTDLKADIAGLEMKLTGLGTKLDTTNTEIVIIRERLARLEERAGIRAAS